MGRTPKPIGIPLLPNEVTAQEDPKAWLLRMIKACRNSRNRATQLKAYDTAAQQDRELKCYEQVLLVYHDEVIEED